MTLQSYPAVSQRVMATRDVVQVSRPKDSGFISWNMDPGIPGYGTSSAGTAGQLFLARIEVPDASVLISLLHIGLGTAAAGNSNCFAGLYDSGGVLRIGSADESAGAWLTPSNPFKSIAGAAGQTWTKPVTAEDFVLLGVLTGAATTMPGFYRGNNSALSLGKTSGASSRWSRYGAGLTALPANLVLANIVNTSLSGQYIWAAIS